MNYQRYLLSISLLSALYAPLAFASPFTLYSWRAQSAGDTPTSTAITLDGTLFDLNGVDTLAPTTAQIETSPGVFEFVTLAIPYDTHLVFSDAPVQVTPVAPFEPLGTLTDPNAFWPADAVSTSIATDARSISLGGVTADPQGQTAATTEPFRTSQQLTLFNNLEALYLGRIAVQTMGVETGTISGTVELLFPRDSIAIVEDPRNRTSAPIDSTINLTGDEFQVISIATTGSYPAPFPPFTPIDLTLNDLYVVRVP